MISLYESFNSIKRFKTLKLKKQKIDQTEPGLIKKFKPKTIIKRTIFNKSDRTPGKSYKK